MPIPMIGPITGEINMAPMITAMELTLRPTEAIRTASIRIQRFGPLSSIPCRTDSMISGLAARSSVRSRRSRMTGMFLPMKMRILLRQLISRSVMSVESEVQDF